MVDIAKQVEYWREGAEEDLAAAYILLEKDRRRHGLFFAHLAVEKPLKALVCRQTQATPPRAHNLLQLARLAQLSLTEEQGKVLGLMNEFCREGRYPDPEDVPPSAAASSRHLHRAKEMVEWLLRRL
jgi:HEPN domain-containing protein